MELTAIATAITTLFASEAIKAGGKSFGEGTTKIVRQLITAVRNKFKATGMEGLLARAEQKPTGSNINIIEAELVAQMEEDEEFANQLRELLEQPEVLVEVERVQIGLINIKATGDLELEELVQRIRGNFVEQTGLENVEAENIKIGKIRQE